MAFSIGNISEFNSNIEDFDTYCSRVDLYFVANDIKGDKIVPSFLTLIGPKVYGLAKNLLSPQDPASCTYDQIKTALKNHFKPKVILIYERFKFHSRSQKPNESVSDFIASLKELAHTCEFGTNLNDMLRDRFVTGLANGRTQHTLLAEADLTFTRAVEIATAREAAQEDVRAMGNSGGNVVYKLNTKSSNAKINNAKNFSAPKGKIHDGNKQFNINKSNSNVPNSPCSGCGKLHWKKDCPFKDAVCHQCGRKGHIKTVCRVSSSKGGNKKPTGHANVKFSNVNVNNTDSSSSYDHVFHVSEVTDVTPSKPIIVHVCLNDREVPMELDTGTAATIMPNDQFEKIWPDVTDRPVLGRSTVNLNVYGGSPLTVLGEVLVTAKLKNDLNSCKVSIAIVQESGPCLLGRDLSSKLEVISNEVLIL